MEQQVVGTIPDFSEDGTIPVPELSERQGIEEVKQDTPDEGVQKEKVILSGPSEEEKPLTDTPEKNNNLERAILGLQNEREKLLKEISELKGKRREIKQESLITVNEKIDELEDLNPSDVTLIDRVLRAKGFITKEEAGKMFYESVKQEELNKFLEKYPEYKPENDSNDLHWNALQRELSYFRNPEDPHKTMEVLERAHRMIIRSSLQNTSVQKHQAEIAGIGSGGVQQVFSSGKKISPEWKIMLEQGGFTNEDIEKMEQRME